MSINTKDKYSAAQQLKEEAINAEQKALDELFGNEGFIPYTPTEDDVMITQYIRPNGRKRIVYAPIGKDYVEKSKNMVCSAIAIYVRWDYQTDEDELIAFATNGLGDNSPNEVLMRIIDQLVSIKEGNK